MTVFELNENEFDELKYNLFYDYNNIVEFNYNLNDEEKEIVKCADYPVDIPNEIVYAVFGGISFVKEDFGCNVD